MHHPPDRIAHTTAFVTPVIEHWLEREIAQWVHPMKDQSDNPSHHDRTLLPRSSNENNLNYLFTFYILMFYMAASVIRSKYPRGLILFPTPLPSPLPQNRYIKQHGMCCPVYGKKHNYKKITFCLILFNEKCRSPIRVQKLAKIFDI